MENFLQILWESQTTKKNNLECLWSAKGEVFLEKPNEYIFRLMDEKVVLWKICSQGYVTINSHDHGQVMVGSHAPGLRSLFHEDTNLIYGGSALMA